MEDGCWVGRGEFDCQQGLKMTAEQGGVEDDLGVGRGEYDRHQGWRMTPGHWTGRGGK